MCVQEYDMIKVQDGRIGLVYAVSEKDKSVMVVLNKQNGNKVIDYPVVAGGLFDGAVAVPLSDILTVLP